MVQKVNQIKSFRDMRVWQKSMGLCQLVYNLTDQLPSAETYNISSQMRRSALSIPSNIAEGFQRQTTVDYRRFINFARGSAAELETQLELAHSLYQLDTTRTALLEIAQVQKMLAKLQQSLTAKISILQVELH